MTLRLYANRRDAAEKQIKRDLEKLGCSVFLMDKPCDFLVGFRGDTHLVECKTPGTQYGKKLNKTQAEFAKSWRGSPVILVHEAMDFMRAIA